MSKIGVALALCVLLLGAALYIGRSVGSQAINQGNQIDTSLSNSRVQDDGTITVTMP